MKILHIVGDSKFGGGSNVIVSLALMAREAGHEVSVLTTDTTFQQVLGQLGICPLNLDVIWRDTRPLRDVRGLLRLSQYLRRGRYSLVHTHTSKAGVVGRLAAKMAGVNVVIHTVHGFPFNEESNPAELFMFSFVERLAAHWCDAIVTVSNFHREWALRLGIGNSAKVRAIPNGIPEERLIPARQTDELRARLQIRGDELFILALGRLARQKGFEDLLRALPLVSKGLPRPIRTVIVGEGPLRERLEAVARECDVSDRVIFAGFQHDVGSFVSACDLVALPSLWEGLSISLLEAMAAGKPIVTTRIGSNIEATRNGDAAILIPPHDPTALAAAISSLASDQCRAMLMGEAAKAIFRESFTEQRMLQAYRTLYDELADKHFPPDSVAIGAVTTQTRGDCPDCELR